MAAIIMPSVCVSCGKNRGTEFWPFRFTISSLSPATAATIFVGIIVTRNTRYKVQFPICSTCRQEKIARKFIRYFVIGLGLAVTAISIMFWITLHTGDPAIPLRANIMCGSALTTLLLPFGLYFVDPPLCSVRYEYFKFRNAIFQSQFAKLNPGLVKPTEK